jgi:hypothetical protein
MHSSQVNSFFLAGLQVKRKGAALIKIWIRNKRKIQKRAEKMSLFSGEDPV